MRRREFVGLLSAIASAQETPQPQAPASSGPGGFAIAGIVVNAMTNAPINKALVMIASTTNRQENRQVVTGADGRFAFTNLPQFKFALTVTRSTGTPQAYLARGNYSTAVVTGPDQDTSNIVFRFHLPGTLAGTVVDENNEPVHSANLHLFTFSIDQTGRRRLMPGQASGVRSSGQFRISHLSPGSYILAITGRPWYADQILQPGPIMAPNGLLQQKSPTPAATDAQFDVTFPLTYYPNTQDVKSAAPILITEGNETTVQVGMHTVPSIHVRVRGGEVKPGVGSNIQVSAVGPEGRPIGLNVAAFLQGSEGELRGLAAGRYQLVISSFNRPRMGQVNGLAEPEEFMAERPGFARKTVDLVDGGVVDLTAASRIALQATVRTVTAEHPTNRIGLSLRDARTGVVVAGMAGQDNMVHFPEANLTAGHYTLALSNTPAFRILAVEAKGAKVTGTEVTIEENSEVQLSVLIGRRSAVNMEGFAVREERGAAGAMVLLLPRKGAPGSDIYQDQSDSDGSFIFRGVTGGDYVAIAIDDGHDLAFGEPTVIERYLAGGVAVRVNEGTALPTLKVPVQQRAG